MDGIKGNEGHRKREEGKRGGGGGQTLPSNTSIGESPPAFDDLFTRIEGWRVFHIGSRMLANIFLFLLHLKVRIFKLEIAFFLLSTLKLWRCNTRSQE